MKVINLGKGKGKTTELVLWLLEGFSNGEPRALIVVSNEQKRRLSKQLHQLWKENGEPHYINMAANRIYTVLDALKLPSTHFRNIEVAIDDADEILRMHLGLYGPISIMSVTDHDSAMDETEK